MCTDENRNWKKKREIHEMSFGILWHQKFKNCFNEMQRTQGAKNMAQRPKSSQGPQGNNLSNKDETI